MPVIRVCILRLFGSKLEISSRVSPTVRIWSPKNLVMGHNSSIGPGVDLYNMALVNVGDRTVISQRAFICAGSHDVADESFQLISKPITIGANVWVAAEAMVGPGAIVEDGAVIGARAVLFGRAASGYIYTGNPAVRLRLRDSGK